MSKGEKGTLKLKNTFYDRPSGSGDLLALKPLLDAIGLNYSSNLIANKKIILTEGITDLLYLKAFNKIIYPDKELNIAPARGSATILYVIPLFISQGISFKIVLDEEVKSNKNQKITKTDLKKAYGIEDKYIYEIPIPQNFRDKIKQAGIEDLFTKNDFKLLLAAFISNPDDREDEKKEFQQVSNTKSPYFCCT